MEGTGRSGVKAVTQLEGSLYGFCCTQSPAGAPSAKRLHYQLDVAQVSLFRMCRNLNMGDVLHSDFFHPPTQYDTIKHT